LVAGSEVTLSEQGRHRNAPAAILIVIVTNVMLQGARPQTPHGWSSDGVLSMK
jgi:hypothetical protein